MLDLNPLEKALRRQQWREANELTRLLFDQTMPPCAEIRRVDALWSDNSGGAFGFTTQSRIWISLDGPPLKPGFDLWTFFERFRDEVGWRDGSHWARWATVNDVREDLFPTLDVDSGNVILPRGCLPFHDVLSGGNWAGFSPRDCWGEFVWDRWAEVFACAASARR